MGKQHMSNHSEESSGSYMTMHMTFKYIFALLMNQNGLTDSCQILLNLYIKHKNTYLISRSISAMQVSAVHVHLDLNRTGLVKSTSTANTFGGENEFRLPSIGANQHGSSKDICSFFDSYLPNLEASTHEITWRMFSTQLLNSSNKTQIKWSSGERVMQFTKPVIFSPREFGRTNRQAHVWILTTMDQNDQNEPGQ
ncbi:hypothetical protein YC2023_083097 [Brassica napus]